MWRRKLKIKLSSIIFSAKTFFVLVLALFILLLIPLSKNISARFRINQEIKGLEAEIASTQNKNNDLNKLITYLNSDQFVEQQARENLNLKKEGEEVVVLRGLNGTEDPAKQPAPEADKSVFSVPGLEKAEAKAEVSNPQKWINYFWGR
jgi:cell division protein FtsB